MIISTLLAAASYCPMAIMREVEAPLDTGQRIEMVDMVERESIIPDHAMVHAIIATESAYRTDARSPAGAVGLMQMTPVALKDVATRANIYERILFTERELPEEDIEFLRTYVDACSDLTIKDMTNPVLSVRAGTCFLHILLQEHKSWTLSLAHYNGGTRQTRNLKSFRKLASETAQYLSRVMYLRDAVCGPVLPALTGN